MCMLFSIDSIHTCCLFIVLPQILTNPEDVTVLTGNSTKLICNASGTEVNYQWLRNGEPLRATQSNILNIAKIKESQEGIYKCVVSNKGGEVESHSATVTVYG